MKYYFLVDDNQIENQLGNENEGSGTAINESKFSLTDNKASIETLQANETKDHDIPLEMSQNACNENKSTSEDNNVTPRLNDEETNGNSGKTSSFESNEATNNSTREKQVMRQHKFYIHSQWLAVQSSYFRSLLFSEAREPNTTEVHVQILDSEEKAHSMLLEAMYKINTLDNASLDELLGVLKLAHQYDVKFVFRNCKYCLQAMAPSIEMFEKIMRLKVDHSIKNIEDLQKVAQTFLAKEFSPLDKTWQTERFKELSEATMKLLLSSDELVTVSENTVFHALMHWIEQHGIEKILESQELPSLLSVVRFELIPIDYLYCIVQHHSVARKLPDFKDHYLRGITYHALSSRLPRSLERRNAAVESFIPYTWKITANELDQVAQTGKPLNSEKFWYCGYRIVLIISRVIKVKDLGGNNKALFDARLSLAVTNLTEQSEVSIRWQAISRTFTVSPVINKSTFTKKTRMAWMSTVEISYIMGVTEELSSSNIPESVKMPELISSTCPSKHNDGLGPPSTCPGAETRILPEPPFQASDRPNSNFLESNENATLATATISGFTSSTPSSTSRTELNLTVSQSSVKNRAETPPPTSSSGFNFTFCQSSVKTSAGTPPSSLTSSSSSGFNFTIPQSSVKTSAGTLPYTSTSSSSSGFNFTIPQTSVKTSAGTLPYTSTSSSSSGFNFTIPQSSVKTSAGTLPYTSTSSSSSGFNFTIPQSSVKTSAGTTPYTSTSSSSSGFNFTIPQSSVKTSAGTTPYTSTSSSSSGFNFTIPQSSVKTSAGTTPYTSTSSSSSGFNFTIPQSSVKTSAGTLPYTSTSSSSSGFNFTIPQTSVKTSSGTLPSSSTSSSSSGLNFTIPQTSVKTSAGTLPSSSTSSSSSGFNFTIPQASVKTSAGTLPSSSSSSSSSGLNFTFSQSSAKTSAKTTTVPGFPSVTPSSTLSGGFKVGVLRTSSRVIFGNKSRTYKNRDIKPTCLSIVVKIKLV